MESEEHRAQVTYDAAETRGSTKSSSSKDKDKVVGVGQGQYKDKEYKVFSIKYKEWVVTNIRIKSE